MNNIDQASIKNYFLQLQDRICALIEAEESEVTFKEEQWTHSDGGGGVTRILTDGAVIEKSGVNFSHINGKNLPTAATDKRPALVNAHFQAQGVSVVIHPRNPYVPTSHFNVRFILVEKEDGAPHWWFGGGFDLTPYFGFTEDCVHWHQMAKAACAPFGEHLYAAYKKYCDTYFYLPHRKEPRGIGGLFFDDLHEGGFAHCFQFIQSVGEHYIKAYQPILSRRRHHTYGQAERDFQLYRRGRYVEFNLLYDRGTLFGLQSGGRTDSILMSLPPAVAWRGDRGDEMVRWEEELKRGFLEGREWV